MIFFVGSLSLIQILFLPGIILLKFFKLHRGAIQTIVFAFGLSLIFNFHWVLLLTLLKINLPILHYSLFAIEIGLALWLYRDKLMINSEEMAAGILKRASQLWETTKALFPKSNTESSVSRAIKILVATLFFIWAIAGIFWIIGLMINEFGTVFNQWDAVVSWNRWGTEWFNGMIPSPKRYPQLIPTNFSITYSFLRSSDIQIFAKSFMPLFTLFAWLLMLDLAFEFKQPGMFIGMVILRYLTKKFLGIYIAEGYVDVALLFFSFLSVYTLLRASITQEEKTKRDYLYLGVIFAAGSALAKQNGLLVFAFYPILALLILEDDPSMPLMELIKKLVKPMALGLLILLPWYILNESRILLGLNQTNVEALVGADRHSGRSYWERAVRAVEILEIYKYLFPIAILSIPLIPKKFRRVGVLMIFPYTIIWMIFFSIFTRNLAMVFPFLAMTVGLGVNRFLDLCLNFLDRIKLPRLKIIFYLLPLVLILVGLGQVVTDSKLIDLQISDQKNALLTKANQELYSYFETQDDYAPIMTSYPIEYLPDLASYKIHEPYTIYKEFYENFSAHPDAAYFLVWEKYAREDVIAQIDYFEEIGAIQFIFKQYNLRFFKVLNREAILTYLPQD